MRILERFKNLQTSSLAAHLRIEIGSASNYAALSHHHYRAKRPATMMRVLVVRSELPGARSRFLGLDEPGEPIGVLVESLPSLSCKMRDAALDQRYGSLPVRQRAKLLNDEVRCISRVIVDPRCRGLGIAVGLVRHALAHATTPYTEALAAMGKVSPFFEQAGMTAYHRPPHAHDARLIAALGVMGDPPCLLADSDLLLRQIEQLPNASRAWLIKEFERWHRSVRNRGGRQTSSLEEQVATARDKLLSTPVYYMHDNLK